MTIVLASAWIPYVAPIKDAGIAGQFKFLTRRGPWVILAAVFTGNAACSAGGATSPLGCRRPVAGRLTWYRY